MFRPFEVVLDNVKCSGIASIPTREETLRSDNYAIPLIIGVHGGGSTLKYFDLSPETSAATVSSLTGIPFISIDRPGYGSMSSVLPHSEGQDFWEETAKWLHRHLIPAIWSEYGVKNGCSSIVLDAHSFGLAPAAMAAALYAQDPDPSYPLAGLIISGMGVRPRNSPEMSKISATHVKIPLEVYQIMMLSERGLVCYDSRVLQHLMERTADQLVGLPVAEIESMGRWYEKGHELTAKIRVPVMYTMGDKDWLFQVNDQFMETFRGQFPSVERFDWSIVQGGPHALEWSVNSYGYYLRCFGWAAEVAAALRRSQSNYLS